jgi:hypothetical protein
MTGGGFDLVSAILILAAAIIPIYFSFRLKNHFRMLMMILSVFALIHGGYHIFEAVGYENIADNIVEPISYAILIIFGLCYLRIRTRKKIEAQ